MKGMLLALFLVQTPHAPGPVRLKDTIKDFPRSELKLGVTGPVSVDLNQTSRVAYEMLAEMAGLNVIFDPDFRAVFMPFRVDKVDILDAFDRLSIETGSFVEVVDSKTIVVSPNNPTKRRDYERMVLKTFYPANRKASQDLTGIITTLRTTLNLRYIAQSVGRNAIVLRDTPDKIAAAEKIISDIDRLSGNPASVLPAGAPIDTGAEIGGILGSRALRKLSSPSELQVKAPGVISMNMDQDSRSAFETIGGLAGINIIFDHDFRSSPISLKLQGATILDALDLLSMQVRSFWEVLDSKTILVSPDNQTKRRDYSRTVVKTIHLSDGTTQQDVIETITALRTLLNMRYIAQVRAANAIVIHDTPMRLAFAEKVVADLSRPLTAPAPAAATSAPFESGSEIGGVLRSRAFRKAANAQPPLQLKVTGPLTVDLTGDARQTYERLAAMAGIRIVFDGRFRSASLPRLTLKDVDLIDALDFLSLQVGAFWHALDATTIIVAPDNQSVRSELEQQTTKTIQLSKLQTPDIGVEIVTALRTLLSSRQVQAVPNGVIMRDTPENLALAERLIADLDR